MPVQSLIRTEGKRCGLFFRYKPPNPDEGFIRIYPGRLKLVICKLIFIFKFKFKLNFSVTDTYRVINVTIDTGVDEVMVEALNQFGLDSSDLNRYRLVEVSLEKGCK